MSTILDTSPTCRYSCPGDPTADILHCFFSCRLTSSAGAWLLSLVKKVDSLATPERIIHLDIEGGEAITWVVIQTLNLLWKAGSDGKSVNLEESRAILRENASFIQNPNNKLAALQYLSVK